MLSNDEHPTLFLYLLGFVVLCMAAVALSLLVDRRMGFSRNDSELKSCLEADRLELEELKVHHDRVSREFREMASNRQLSSETATSFELKLADTNGHRMKLLAARNELEKSLLTLKEDFSQYRRRYRDKIWTGAMGQSLGTVTTRNGREFHKSVIIQVTETGLDIRHEHGTARLNATDLDSAMQDRFLWGEEERRSNLE